MVSDNQSQQVRESWYALREFETHDVTTRSYQNRHSRQLKSDKAREITSNFIQAREYFRSAAAADFTVRPLLQYYGVATLSRGITLFLRADRRECALSQRHGLDSLKWQQTLSKGLSDIGDLRIEVTKGVFHDLLVATDNRFYFRHDSTAVNAALGASVPPVSSEFTFEEIVARIPDLRSQYFAWTGASLNFTNLISIEADNAKIPYKYTVPVSAESHVDSIFPIEAFSQRQIHPQGANLTVEFTQGVVPFLAQQTGTFDKIEDAVVLCDSLDSHLYFTPLAAGYMSSVHTWNAMQIFPNDVDRISAFNERRCGIPADKQAVGLDTGQISRHDCRHPTRPLRFRNRRVAPNIGFDLSSNLCSHPLRSHNSA